MKLRRLFVVALAVLISPLTMAGPLIAFDATSFDRLTASGAPVAVVVHADWCPVCKVQLPIQKELMASPEFADVTMFSIDFDADKALVKRFAVVKQSTLIVFKGEKEVGRSIGDTSREGMLALLRKGTR